MTCHFHVAAPPALPHRRCRRERRPALAPALQLLMLALLGFAGAPTQALGFEQAQRLAEQRSPALQMLRAQRDAAEVAQPAAGLLPDPKLGVGVENLPLSGANRLSLGAEPMTMQRIALMQDMPNAAKRSAQRALAQARVAREQAQLDAARLQLWRELAGAWLALDYSRQRDALVQRLQAENELLQRSLPARIAGASAAPAEALSARQEALALADRRDEIGRESGVARAALARLLGAAALQGPAGPEPLDALRLPEPAPAQLRAQLPRHQDLRLFEPLQAQAEAQLGEARAEEQGDWGWELAYSRRGAQWGDMLSLQLRFDLPWQRSQRQRPQTQAMALQAEALRAQREETLRRLEESLDGQLSELRSLEAQIGRQQDLALPLADDRLSLALAAYAGGRAGLAEVLVARQGRLEAGLRLLALQERHALLRVAMQPTLGE